jgi:hypothetical protein
MAARRPAETQCAPRQPNWLAAHPDTTKVSAPAS